MRVLTIILLCFICSFAYAQDECGVSKVDEEGCLVDEKSFTNLVDRLCDVEKLEDENTQYKFNIDCEDGAFLFEVFSSDGESDDAKKIDLNDCIEPFEPTICRGPFQLTSSRTSWWETWTPVITANTGTVTNPNWFPVGSSVTSPDCITDMSFDIDFGNHYFLQRENRVWFWMDYRLLVNGAAVLTRTYECYHYHSETTDTTPDTDEPLQYELENLCDTEDVRLNIPAGATVQVEARTRYNVNSSQDNSYFRYIGGLRSNTVYHFSPKQIVTE